MDQGKFLNALKEALEIENREVQLSDKFKEYQEWDSLSRLSLIALLDDEYDIQIEEDDFKDLDTVEDLFNAVNKK